MVKKAVSSVDVFFLARELEGKLSGSRVDSVFEVGEKTLVFEVFKSGAGKMSLVVAPDFLCVSQYPREKPKEPSSFVMQLRKRLKGCFIRAVSQHAFDRIVELELEGGDEKYTLIIEVFSKGNILLCDKDRKIIGLLEWQKWRDRKLGVGQVYEYPPATVNPLALGDKEVAAILSSSAKDVVRCLAVECGLGGLYAEEVCARAGVDKNIKAGELASRLESVAGAYRSVVSDISPSKLAPRIILEDGKPSDVVPLELNVHAGLLSKTFASFNEAVDEYFTTQEFAEKKSSFESKYEDEKGKLERRLSEQEKALERACEDIESYRQAGDLLYARKHEIEPVLSEIRAMRKKGLSDDEVLMSLAGRKFVKALAKTELTLEL